MDNLFGFLLAVQKSNGGGGGGYSDKTLCNATVILTTSVEDIPFDDGTDLVTSPVWTVKINDIELPYNSASNRFTKTINGTTYTVQKYGGHDGYVLNVFTGSSFDPTIVAGSYKVEITSPPAVGIITNSTVDVSDAQYAIVKVPMQIRTYRNINITHSATSDANYVYVGFAGMMVSGGDEIVQKNPISSSIGTYSKGTTRTEQVLANPSSGITPIIIATLSSNTLEITGATGNQVTYSNDQTMAVVQNLADNASITITVHENIS